MGASNKMHTYIFQPLVCFLVLECADLVNMNMSLRHFKPFPWSIIIWLNPELARLVLPAFWRIPTHWLLWIQFQPVNRYNGWVQNSPSDWKRHTTVSSGCKPHKSTYISDREHTASQSKNNDNEKLLRTVTKIATSPAGIQAHTYYAVPSAHQSLQPKRHLMCLSFAYLRIYMWMWILTCLPADLHCFADLCAGLWTDQHMFCLLVYNFAYF